MKKLTSLVLLAVFSIVSFNANAQVGQDWKWQHQSPQGNLLRWIKIWNSNVWYAAGYKSTFMKTTNAGASWFVTHKAGGQAYNYVLNGSDIYDAHFFNFNTGVVAGQAGFNGGFARTTDGGMTWDTAYSNTVTSGIFYKVFFLNNNLGWAVGTTTPKIWSTTNGGITWSGMSTAPTTTLYDVYAWDSLTLGVVTTSGNFIKSTDGGATWSATISTGNTGVCYRLYFKNANTGYVAGSAGKFSFTTNSGANWTLAATGATSTMYDIDVWVDNSLNGITVNNVFITGNNKYIYKSTNNGTTWDTIGFRPDSTIQKVTGIYYGTDLFQNSDTLVTVGATGLINKRSSLTDRQIFTNNLKTVVTYDIWAESANGIVLAVGDRTSTSLPPDQILRSTNGGLTWSAATINGNPQDYFYSIYMINNATGWVCGTRYTAYKTTNGGVSWDSIPVPFTPSGTTNGILSRVQFLNLNTGWIFCRNATGDTSNIIKTTDGGASWTKGRITGASGNASYVYCAEMLDANTGYGANFTPSPIKTTDGGLTWTVQTLIDGYTGTLYNIDMVNANTGFLVGGGARMYKTTNGGLLWDTIPNRPGGTSATWYGVNFFNEHVGFVAGGNGSVLTTINGGANWTVSSTGGGTIYRLFVKPTFAFTASLSSNIFKNVNIITSVPGSISAVPEFFELFQNYPNPFNPVTTIKFALPKTALVSIKVYDIAGREVMNLVNNQTMNAGYQSQTFNGVSLSSGVYFYSLIVDNNIVATKKMVLLK